MEPLMPQSAGFLAQKNEAAERLVELANVFASVAAVQRRLLPDDCRTLLASGRPP